MLVPVFYQPYPSVVLTNELTANTHRLLLRTFYSSFLCSFRLELSRQASHITYFFSFRISKINWSSALFLPSQMLLCIPYLKDFSLYPHFIPSKSSFCHFTKVAFFVPFRIPKTNRFSGIFTLCNVTTFSCRATNLFFSTPFTSPWPLH